MENIDKCTRCGNQLTDLRIDISFEITADRLKESSVWEKLPNLTNLSREVLCFECFDKFTTLMSSLNIEYSPEGSGS